jgi:Fe-Mn family superoxide dismutase
MKIQLPPLPYALDALEPVISKQTLEHHYLKHHQAYVDKLNTLIPNTPYETMSLEEIIFESSSGSEKDKKIFNNAAQVWNHTFYWSSMTPEKQEASATVKEALQKSFGSPEEFIQQFTQAGKDLFGSGWVWLVKDEAGKLWIKAKENAGNPIADGETPLLVVDVWEHAYYLDQQEKRAAYLDKFPSLIDWAFVEANLKKAALFMPQAKRKSTQDSSQIRQ